MKTAEEILRNYFPKPTNEGEKNDDISIINMMKEYAQQESERSVNEFKDRFIREINTHSSYFEDDGHNSKLNIEKLIEQLK